MIEGSSGSHEEEEGVVDKKDVTELNYKDWVHGISQLPSLLCSWYCPCVCKLSKINKSEFFLIKLEI